MKKWVTKKWKHETSGIDGNTMLFGVNIFDYKWKDTQKEAVVHDPLYGQEYTASVYAVEIDGKQHEFAATEFSNCVWGFYLYKF